MALGRRQADRRRRPRRIRLHYFQGRKNVSHVWQGPRQYPCGSLGALLQLSPLLGGRRSSAQISGVGTCLRTRKETIALTAADSLRRRAALAARPDSIVT